MCLDGDAPTSSAPDPLIDLTSADGSRFGAYLAGAEEPTGARLVLLPDVGGMRAPFRNLARRFARTGADVLVIDYYGRTLGPGARGEEYDPAINDSFDRELVLADLAAAVAHLRAAGDGPVYAAGFCIGGANALYAGTADLGLAGVIGICPYVGAMGASAALPDDFGSGIRVPVLGLFGGADTEVPASVHENLERHLAAVDVPHEIVVYPGQPHGFIEWDHFGRDGHAEAAADAWARIAAFLKGRS
ncbi:carboxymethylenebutenolidase [Longispora fulva]|uniref:Carboxymethylenebutenolidase n=1 Tax=Longispora fulva TaxID=619741 RepID=A0A8J7KQN7_9ACTN|nr:dienelactone hydrolase family protein [Longispora fulva]MBG6137622.1 carboxymethylenebutenolidase [Longispora fulva]GIG62220.1 carboxymethylenebutenolidase [Longispora fulva]